MILYVTERSACFLVACVAWEGQTSKQQILLSLYKITWVYSSKDNRRNCNSASIPTVVSGKGDSLIIANAWTFSAQHHPVLAASRSNSSVRTEAAWKQQQQEEEQQRVSPVFIKAMPSGAARVRMGRRSRRRLLPWHLMLSLLAGTTS